MIWASVDAALKLSGVALWDGLRLVEAFTVRPMGSKGQWAMWSHGVKIQTHERRWSAWGVALTGPGHAMARRVILPAEHGGMRNSDRALGRACGYIEAVCDYIGAVSSEIELSTWRRAIVEEMAERGTPITWPPGETKAVAIAVARQLYPQLGADVTDDEAEAVLIGHAARRLRLVEV